MLRYVIPLAPVTKKTQRRSSGGARAGDRLLSHRSNTGGMRGTAGRFCGLRPQGPSIGR